jgi:4-amino-4-deoxy-L-arabinose transferase-like glycosyltransferase
MWKAPAYPAWVGFWYELLGSSPLRLSLVQGLVMAPLGVLATWGLGRHLFGAGVGVVAAFVIAVFPLAWEFHGLLYPETLAIPLTTLVLLLFLARTPTPPLALAVGAAIGAAILVRPNSFFLFAGVLAAWMLAAGWRRGLGLTALSVAVAALVVAPWTIRNYVVTDGEFIPISIQDGAIYGTFNEVSANDPIYPYAWRFAFRDPPAVYENESSDAEFRSELQQLAFDYIEEHPFSLVEAFYWNGLSRFWDVRRPGRAIDEVPFTGRSEGVAWAGLAMYYVLLPLALLGLWRARRRREVVLPLLVTALAASAVFTVASGTRYRAPLEPAIAVLAVSALAPLLDRRGRAAGEPRPG